MGCNGDRHWSTLPNRLRTTSRTIGLNGRVAVTRPVQMTRGWRCVWSSCRCGSCSDSARPGQRRAHTKIIIIHFAQICLFAGLPVYLFACLSVCLFAGLPVGIHFANLTSFFPTCLRTSFAVMESRAATACAWCCCFVWAEPGSPVLPLCAVSSGSSLLDWRRSTNYRTCYLQSPT